MTECCDTVQCWSCLYRALEGGNEKEKEKKCLSIACFQPIPERIVRLAAAWRAHSLLPNASSNVTLRLVSPSNPPVTSSLTVPSNTCLLSLVSQALTALSVPQPAPKLRLFIQHSENQQRFPISSMKKYQSLATLEFHNGDTLVVDAEGRLPSEECPYCDSIVPSTQCLVFPCDHWFCLACASLYARKHGRREESMAGLPCPETLCTSVFSTSAPSQPQLLVWKQLPPLLAPIPQPGISTRRWITECSRLAGLSEEEAADHQAFVADNWGVRLLEPSNNPISTQTFKPDNLILIPNSIVNKIKLA